MNYLKTGYGCHGNPRNVLSGRIFDRLSEKLKGAMSQETRLEVQRCWPQYKRMLLVHAINSRKFRKLETFSKFKGAMSQETGLEVPRCWPQYKRMLLVRAIFIDIDSVGALS